jgi:hypothetical protein
MSKGMNWNLILNIIIALSLFELLDKGFTIALTTIYHYMGII